MERGRSHAYVRDGVLECLLHMPPHQTPDAQTRVLRAQTAHLHLWCAVRALGRIYMLDVESRAVDALTAACRRRRRCRRGLINKDGRKKRSNSIGACAVRDVLSIFYRNINIIHAGSDECEYAHTLTRVSSQHARFLLEVCVCARWLTFPTNTNRLSERQAITIDHDNNFNIRKQQCKRQS